MLIRGCGDRSYSTYESILLSDYVWENDGMGSSQDRRRESRERMRLFQEWDHVFLVEGADDRKAKSYFLAYIRTRSFTGRFTYDRYNRWQSVDRRDGYGLRLYVAGQPCTMAMGWDSSGDFILFSVGSTVIMAGTGYCAVVGQTDLDAIWSKIIRCWFLDIPKWPTPTPAVRCITGHEARSNGASPVLKENPHRQPTAPKGFQAKAEQPWARLQYNRAQLHLSGQQGGQTAGT